MMNNKAELGAGTAGGQITSTRSQSQLRQVVRHMARNQAAVISLAFVLVVVLASLAAPVVAPYDPIEIDAYNTIQPPNAAHWFGTDDTGRDVFSRVIWGGRISLRVGLISAGIATLVGTLLGLISGYFGGAIGFGILRLVDLMLAFPGILLALVIVSTLGPSLDNVMIAIGVSAIPTFTRVVHGSVLSTREDDYVKAAILVGCPDWRIILRHVVPNVMAPVIVLSTLQIAGAIFGAASLSFIGLGAQPPTPEWGAMVSRGRYALRSAMWMSTFPGLAIATVVIAINIIGDALRDALDPYMRER